MIGTVTYQYVLAESHALFDYHLRQMALSLRDQGSVLPPPVSREEREQLDFVVQIWNADGSKIYLSQTRSKARLPDKATLGFVDVVTQGERWRVYGTLARGRVIQVGQPFEVRQRIAARAALRSLTPLLVLAPLVALAIWWLVGRSLEPIVRVARDLRKRDAQRLDPISQATLPVEIEPMIGQLNALLARLELAFAAQRAFVADAAHELRTPIAALKLQAGLLARAREERSRSEALGELHAGIDRAAHLVDQLLTLARNEHGGAPASDAGVDLARVADEVLAAMKPLAHARGARLELLAPPSAELRGDAAALHGLLRNLVDNALRHSGPGRRVRVELAGSAQALRLAVEDDGPGIPPEDRERVFDRFHGRAGGGEAGSGLGLAIARAVVERHEGRIELGDSALGGLAVVVTLPRRPP